MKKCGHSGACGCKDVALSTPPPCPQGVNCPEPTSCSEIWAAECVIYNGDSIYEIGIYPGETVSTVMQKLLLFATNPSCANFLPDSTCQSVLNVRSTDITSSSIDLSWDNSLVAT